MATCETRLNFLGCRKLVNRSQPLVGRSSPYCGGHVEGILLFNKFYFRLSIHALVAKIQSDKIVRRCPDGEFSLIFCVPYFQRAACSTFSDLHSKFALRRHRVWKYGRTSNLRRLRIGEEKKERRRRIRNHRTKI